MVTYAFLRAYLLVLVRYLLYWEPSQKPREQASTKIDHHHEQDHREAFPSLGQVIIGTLAPHITTEVDYECESLLVSVQPGGSCSSSKTQ